MDRQRTSIETATVIDGCPACSRTGKQLRRRDTDERGVKERRLCYACGCRWSLLPSGA